MCWSRKEDEDETELIPEDTHEDVDEARISTDNTPTASNAAEATPQTGVKHSKNTVVRVEQRDISKGHHCVETISMTHHREDVIIAIEAFGANLAMNNTKDEYPAEVDKCISLTMTMIKVSIIMMTMQILK